MRRLQEAFPEVFLHAISLTFAMHYQLPVSRAAATNYDINLPLLTHLLSEQHPQLIAPSTLKSKIGPQSFCSYNAELSISSKVGTKV
jgi:hypothetical protein